ncbi:nitric oxide reductase activation protein NorD [Methylocella silvestris]|uniref:nitric oxide reductase activation protein NorD n=1 Tax=Methylocella silvestris TaxID=199596 RepID=UPI001FCA4A45|nr:VWA domain-containing protein [Methylocella silvestris]
MRVKFWEPEEAVGTLWDGFVEGLEIAPSYPEAAVELAQERGALAVLFRGLGGERGVEVKAGGGVRATHRRSWRRRLAREAERVQAAHFDGATLLLPERIDIFSEPELNRKLYLWLAALAVVSAPPDAGETDPLRRDVARLRKVTQDCEEAVSLFPGLRSIRDELYPACLASRAVFRGPPLEAEIEAWIRARLAQEPEHPSDTPLSRALAGMGRADDVLTAPADYRSFRPLLLWGERSPLREAGPSRAKDGDHEAGSGASDGAEKARAAQRRKSDQADRRDSLILHRFESILSFADFLNINRKVEDDDEDSARKAADDAEEIGVADHRQRPKTRLKFDLDLSPEDGDREMLAGRFVYPEWDWKKNALVADQARVLENTAPQAPGGRKLDARSLRRIEAVRKQFEALRPRRKMLSRQYDGGELDLDEVVRAAADRLACGRGSERLYRAARNEERDLAVAVLLDASRSTESSAHGEPVIAVAREALIALARGLDACGDQFGLYAFSSLRRDRVFVDVCKTFDEPLGGAVDARINALKPGFYTRLGAAIRHVSFRLGERPNARKLLLVITDGKPNDLDHYEGRFGVEDTRRAVQEARRQGQTVFAITIDAEARAYLPRLFGRSGFALAPTPDRLTEALPSIYRQILS